MYKTFPDRSSGFLKKRIISARSFCHKNLLFDWIAAERIFADSRYNFASGRIRLFRALTGHDIWQLIGLGNFLYSAFYYASLRLLPSTAACIINYLWPIDRLRSSHFTRKNQDSRMGCSSAFFCRCSYFNERQRYMTVEKSRAGAFAPALLLSRKVILPYKSLISLISTAD